MRRTFERALAGLAVGAAVVALFRRAPVGETAPVEWQAGPPPQSAMPPARGVDRMRFVLEELGTRLRMHHTGIVAASLAYYAMLAFVPSLIAAVAIYGLATDPSELERQIEFVADTLPADAARIITDQLTQIVQGDETGLGLAVAGAILVAVWSASAGTKALISGINLAHGLPESRSFIQLRGMAMLITFGAALFVGFVAWFISLVNIAAGTVWQEALLALGVLGALIVFLAVLYKLAPNRPTFDGAPVTAGALAATLLLVVTTSGFTVFVSNFGSYGATYGALAGVVVLLLWFFLSGFVVLLGAELNAELEHVRRRRSSDA